MFDAIGDGFSDLSGMEFATICFIGAFFFFVMVDSREKAAIDRQIYQKQKAECDALGGELIRGSYESLCQKTLKRLSSAS